LKTTEVTAAVIVDGSLVLLARRSPGKQEAGKWEFPGGKREPNETLKECLVRELREEMGVDACIHQELIRCEYEYSHGRINLVAFNTQLQGAPLVSKDHDQIMWIPIDSLLTYELAPADVPIAEFLQGKSGSGIMECES